SNCRGSRPSGRNTLSSTSGVVFAIPSAAGDAVSSVGGQGNEGASQPLALMRNPRASDWNGSWFAGTVFVDARTQRLLTPSTSTTSTAPFGLVRTTASDARF